MPTYEFKCLKCGHKFEVFASMSEKSNGLELTCPECGSDELGEVFGPLIYVSKTNEIRSDSCSCGSCKCGG